MLVIGKAGHVEVRGIAEDLPSHDVDRLGRRRADIGTYEAWCGLSDHVHRARTSPGSGEAIEAANPHAEVRFIDTVCRPTKQRQRAVESLLDQVEAMVVVGGRNSNNTRELTTRCRERGVPVVQVADASELDPSWFAEFDLVGLTAGTSTLARDDRRGSPGLVADRSTRDGLINPGYPCRGIGRRRCDRRLQWHNPSLRAGTGSGDWRRRVCQCDGEA